MVRCTKLIVAYQNNREKQRVFDKIDFVFNGPVFTGRMCGSTNLWSAQDRSRRRIYRIRISGYKLQKTTLRACDRADDHRPRKTTAARQPVRGSTSAAALVALILATEETGKTGHDGVGSDQTEKVKRGDHYVYV